MQKYFSRLETLAVAGLFSTISGWCGFMFGRKSAQKEFGKLIQQLQHLNSASHSPPRS